MRRRQGTEETEDETGSWFGRVRGRSSERTEDTSRGWFGRTRGKSAERTEDTSGSWFGRARAKYGLGALLVAAGVVLFVFPEPITSTAGIALIAVGVLIWLAGLLR